MYVLDSCICIDIMRGKLPLAYNIMRQCDPKQFTLNSRESMAHTPSGGVHNDDPNNLQ